jgi:hypothetical protein
MELFFGARKGSSNATRRNFLVNSMLAAKQGRQSIQDLPLVLFDANFRFPPNLGFSISASAWRS